MKLPPLLSMSSSLTECPVPLSLTMPCPSLSQNALLPAGFRQKDQTTKPATGPFDRERLLSYLEKQALEHKDREDFVPFTGEKKGTVHAGAGTGNTLPG